MPVRGFTPGPHLRLQAYTQERRFGRVAVGGNNSELSSAFALSADDGHWSC